MANLQAPQFTGRIYDNEYFSGTQAALYIGDVLVDEVTSYAFNIQQNKTPLYGYASQLFNAVSKGTVIVTGGFSINFKEANYLYLVLMRYQAFNRTVDEQIRKATNHTVSDQNIKSFLKSIPQETGFGPYLPRLPSPFQPQSKKEIRQGIERLLNGQASTSEKYEFYQSLGGFASTFGLDIEFENLAEVLEDSVWGIDAKQADDMIRRTDDNYFDGFDMYFTYGDYNNPDANHTVERIMGVHLTSRSKAVSVSGEPIQEEYQFIARNSF
jgi:hypothetical protein